MAGGRGTSPSIKTLSILSILLPMAFQCTGLLVHPSMPDEAVHHVSFSARAPDLEFTGLGGT